MDNDGRVYEATTSPAEQPPRKGLHFCGRITAHLSPIRLLCKVLQLVLSFLAFVLEEVLEVCTNCSGLYFFEFVSCSAFLLCIPILALYCTSLYKKIGKEQIKRLDFWIVSVTGIFFSLASIVFSATNDGTSVEIAAVVCGFLASIAFIMEAAILLHKRRHARKETPQEYPTKLPNQPEHQPLNNQPA